MIATIALVAALAFIGVAIYRLSPAAPARLRNAQLALALAAGLFGVAAFKGSFDSRMLVGGVLMFGAAIPGFMAGRRRALKNAALICGVLGFALFAIAMTRPMAQVPVAA